jgi:hypothetical protein
MSRQPIFNLSISASQRLVCRHPAQSGRDGFAEKKCFLPNEPKVVQCLPVILKKAKPFQSQKKPVQTQSKANF